MNILDQYTSVLDNFASKYSYYKDPVAGEIISMDRGCYLKKINPDTYKMNGHTVIVFGGNMTYDVDSAARQGALADNLLSLLYKGNKNKGDNGVRDDIHILSFAYGIVDEDDLRGSFNKTTNRAIASKLLMQKCVDESGEILSVDEACRGLSQVTFFTFCHGAIEVNKIIDEFKKCLIKNRYSEEDIDKIISSLGQVTYAPEHGCYSAIPTIRFDSKFDFSMGNYRRLLLEKEGVMHKYKGIELRYFPKGEFWGRENKEMAETVNVFSQKLLNAFRTPIDEHSIGYLKRDFNWDWLERNSEGISRLSEPRSDVNNEYKKSDNADCVSQMVAWSLSRMVENGLYNMESNSYIPRMPLNEIMTELESIRDGYSPESLL